MIDGQTSIFDFLNENKQYKIKNKIRLIELFAGIGSQAKALQRLGADFEHHRVVEFDKYAIKSYNAVHGTNFETSDVTKIHASDLGITETNMFTYIMTYSFPCQDLSIAGKQKGMEKGSGTRSGLLWEVERILNECTELPQVLLMENVPQVHGNKNMGDFKSWIDFLEQKGYSNYWKDLNSKDYGIPQGRNRCFMVSVLGSYSFEFPKPQTLTLRLKDLLEDEVDEKFYLSEEMQLRVKNTLKNKDALMLDLCQWRREGTPREYNEIAPTLSARDYKEPRCVQVGTLDIKGLDCIKRVYSVDGLSPTISTMQGGNRQPKIHESTRIRRLTPLECWRLMGFDDEDFHKAEKVNSNTQLYKQAGNSIVVNVLEAIFKQMI